MLRCRSAKAPQAGVLCSKMELRNLIKRFALLGIAAGMLVGVFATDAVIIIWCIFGQPDFYFRGLGGAFSHLMSMILLLTLTTLENRSI